MLNLPWDSVNFSGLGVILGGPLYNENSSIVVRKKKHSSSILEEMGTKNYHQIVISNKIKSQALWWYKVAQVPWAKLIYTSVIIALMQKGFDQHMLPSRPHFYKGHHVFINKNAKTTFCTNYKGKDEEKKPTETRLACLQSCLVPNRECVENFEMNKATMTSYWCTTYKITTETLHCFLWTIL